eukprot:7381707-Pyramimonas_sp.AAC.1
MPFRPSRPARIVENVRGGNGDADESRRAPHGVPWRVIQHHLRGAAHRLQERGARHERTAPHAVVPQERQRRVAVHPALQLARRASSHATWQPLAPSADARIVGAMPVQQGEGFRERVSARALQRPHLRVVPR